MNAYMRGSMDLNLHLVPVQPMIHDMSYNYNNLDCSC